MDRKGNGTAVSQDTPLYLKLLMGHTICSFRVIMTKARPGFFHAERLSGRTAFRISLQFFEKSLTKDVSAILDRRNRCDPLATRFIHGSAIRT